MESDKNRGRAGEIGLRHLPYKPLGVNARRQRKEEHCQQHECRSCYGPFPSQADARKCGEHSHHCEATVPRVVPALAAPVLLRQRLLPQSSTCVSVCARICANLCVCVRIYMQMAKP
jgi:hypothetical protein